MHDEQRDELLIEMHGDIKVVNERLGRLEDIPIRVQRLESTILGEGGLMHRISFIETKREKWIAKSMIAVGTAAAVVTAVATAAYYITVL